MKHPPDSLAKQTGPRRRIPYPVVAVAAVLWLSAVVAGLVWMAWFSNLPGRTWATPVRWPTESQISLHANQPTLIMFAHPHCPCTRASVGELERLMAQGQGRVSAQLWFIQPPDLAESWTQTDFHVFGSLAFLAIYRDWRVLASATVVVAIDHFARGVFWPQSAFGVLTTSPWRWVEHAGWVLFEDTFLIISIRQSLGEMFEVAARHAQLENLNEEIERKVAERTAELIRSQTKLVEASRQAGMSEVATSVLHNVGNVLNSVNVSCSVIAEKVRQSRIRGVAKTAELLRKHSGDLAGFLTTDPSGRKLPDYLIKLAARLIEEQDAVLDEVQLLNGNIGHIKDIIAVQQNHAKQLGGVRETVPIQNLVEDALRMNAGPGTGATFMLSLPCGSENN